MEANNASSKKDFQNKIFICKKEAQETKYWLKLLLKVEPSCEKECIELTDEVQQFILIFQKIISTMKNGK
ncbi:MAG: four helix bundle protein [Candidatus Levybacteria bacterium]|nr:four helix bundle protein [Candidatus Levybacteria bacterium]